MRPAVSRCAHCQLSGVSSASTPLREEREQARALPPRRPMVRGHTTCTHVLGSMHISSLNVRFSAGRHASSA